MGATDPNTKMQKFMQAMGAFAQIAQMPGINKIEISKEIFGLAGYKDGTRFFGDGKQDQEKMQMQQMIQQMQQQMLQMQQALASKQQKDMANIQVEREKIASNEKIEAINAMNDREKIASQERIAEERLKLDKAKAIVEEEMARDQMRLDDFAKRLDMAYSRIA
jgi:hypothetical protein